MSASCCRRPADSLHCLVSVKLWRTGGRGARGRSSPFRFESEPSYAGIPQELALGSRRNEARYGACGACEEAREEPRAESGSESGEQASVVVSWPGEVSALFQGAYCRARAKRGEGCGGLASVGRKDEEKRGRAETGLLHMRPRRAVQSGVARRLCEANQRTVTRCAGRPRSQIDTRRKTPRRPLLTSTRSTAMGAGARAACGTGKETADGAASAVCSASTTLESSETGAMERSGSARWGIGRAASRGRALQWRCSLRCARGH